MKKVLFTIILMAATAGMKAQYAKINEILTELEQRKGFNTDLKNVNIDDKKFVILKDFDDHKERQFIVIKGNQATFAEVFDDKTSGQTSSNVFTGDVVRTSRNVLSFRFDKLEGQKIALPIAKTLMMTQQKKTLYLVDLNTKERWIEEAAIGMK